MKDDKHKSNAEGVLKHSDENGSIIVGETDKGRRIFNIQPNKSKPYSSNMVKPSGSSKQK